MKKFLIILLTTIMSFGFSSCVSSQSIAVDYQRVYFDHVVYGFAVGDSYVYDGTYSYHVVSGIPSNVYWELTPIGYEVCIYTKQMVRLGLYDYNRRYIFYNRTFHNHYPFTSRHRPPFVRPRHNPGNIPMVKRHKHFRPHPRPMDRDFGRLNGVPRPSRYEQPPKGRR